jgi:hypothetical protein
MCDELGDTEMMFSVVTEYGKTSLCSVVDGEGCSDKEMKFIEKWKDAAKDKIDAQLARLTKMSGGKMAADLMKWVSQRIAVLKQFGELEPEPAKEEL